MVIMLARILFYTLLPSVLLFAIVLLGRAGFFQGSDGFLSFCSSAVMTTEGGGSAASQQDGIGGVGNRHCLCFADEMMGGETDWVYELIT